MFQKWCKIAIVILVLGIGIGALTACTGSGKKEMTPTDTGKENVNVYSTITFDLAGGTMENVLELRVKPGTVLALAEYMPVRDGFTFTGWKSGELLHQPDASITVVSDLVLVAEWSEIIPKTYTVTLDSAGGVMDTPVFQNLTAGSVIPLSEYRPIKDGYCFIGWKDGNGRLYAAEETFTVQADAVLTAVWRLAQTDVSEFTFKMSDDQKSYILTGLSENFNVETVVVPGSYQSMPVTAIGDGVFSGKEQITLVDLSYCTELVKIGSWNFWHCDNLRSVNLEGCGALASLGDSCFSVCPRLTEINLKGLFKLETIGSSCFYGYNAASSLPVSALDFSDCTSLKSVGQMSFWYLSELSVLDFSATGIETFERQNIRFNSKLEKVVLPATLRADQIGSEFLTDNDNLKEIRVDELSLFLCTEEGILYNTEKTILFKVPAKAELTNYVAPASLTEIKEQAFKNVVSLTSADFSACTLERIGYEAFSGCSGAVITVPFDINGKDKTGMSVDCGNKWNFGVKEIQYAPTVLLLTVTGIPKDNKTSEGSVTLTVVSTCPGAMITVMLNGTVVDGESGTYILALATGSNTVVVKAEFQGQKVEETYTVERTVAKPTVSSTLEDGKVYTGQYIEFDVTARSASSEILGKDAIVIKTDWGYGLQPVAFCTMTDEADGTVHVKIDFDSLWNNFYYEGGIFTLQIEVTDGDDTVSVSYRIEYVGEYH